jgi:hypothetical protein
MNSGSLNKPCGMHCRSFYGVMGDVGRVALGTYIRVYRDAITPQKTRSISFSVFSLLLHTAIYIYVLDNKTER